MAKDAASLYAEESVEKGEPITEVFNECRN